MVRKLESLASESATLHAYLREISHFPQLTPDDEQELGRQIQQHGDEDAVGRLVQANLRFVAGYAERFGHLGVPILELIHEGNLGLIEAARRFDPAQGGRFQGHAMWWVRQAVLHLLGESPRVTHPTTAGLMVAVAAGRQVDALKISLDHAQAGPAAPVGPPPSLVEPPARRRRVARSRRRTANAVARLDAGILHALRQHTVLRSYLN